MKLLKNSESGQTMIMALILLALGSLLVVPLLNHSFTNLGHHQSIECRTLNSYTADSGVEYVLQKIYSDPGGYTTENLTESFTLNNRTVNVTAEYQGGGIYKITSKVTGGGCGSATITSYVNLSAGAFAFVVAAKESMTISGKSTVNATDPGGARIHSNWDITLEGVNVWVDGYATAVDNITGVDNVLDYQYPVPPIQFPGDYSELYRTIALEGGIDPDGLDIMYDQELGPLYIDGDLWVKPNVSVYLTGTVYVTGDIIMDFGSSGILYGEQNMVTEKIITIHGGEIRSEYIPLIMSTGEYIEVDTGIVNAVLYAPNGYVELNNVHVYGAVGGKTVIVTASDVTYAAELEGRQDLPGGELSTIAYSYE